jgi:tetraacyldisaccharide 4'-kinase
MKALSNFIERVWYGRVARYWPVIVLLLPLSLLFLIVSRIRKNMLLNHQAVLPVPVIVVGNISVGGTGENTAAVRLGWCADKTRCACRYY